MLCLSGAHRAKTASPSSVVVAGIIPNMFPLTPQAVRSIRPRALTVTVPASCRRAVMLNSSGRVMPRTVRVAAGSGP